MRSLEQGFANVVSVPNVVRASKLTAANGDIDDAVDYAVEDCVHTGLLNFSNVFLNKKNAFFEISNLTIWEKSTAPIKLAMSLYLFNYCDISPVKNEFVTFSSSAPFLPPDDSDYAWLKMPILEADYEEIKSNNSVVGAKASIYVPNLGVEKYIGNYNQSLDLKGILVSQEATTKFASDAELKAEIYGILH